MSEQALKSLPLPPGKLGWPIIGETFDLIADSSQFVRERHQKYGEIFKTNILGQPTIYAIGPEAVGFFLTNENKYIEVNLLPSMKSLLGDSLPNQTGEIHKSRRQILSQAFKFRALADYLNSMVKITEDYLEKWRDRGNLTWYPELQDYTFDVAGKFLIGLRGASDKPLRHLYESWTAGLFSFTPWRLPWTKFGRAWKSRQQLLREIEKLLEKRQQESDAGLDALSILIKAYDEEGKHLSLTELKDQLLNLLFAGHSTLTSALASFCLLMAQHPQILAKVREEQQQLSGPITLEQLKQMTYLEQVLQEVLRLIPPVGGGFRKVLKDCEFKGYHIPQGWSLIYQINETHQDIRLWSDPNKFDPERFSSDNKNRPFSYIPFGGGMRECLGKEFAKLEMKVFAALLVRNYSWTLIPAQDLNLELIPFPRPRDGLKVNFRTLA